MARCVKGSTTPIRRHDPIAAEDLHVAGMVGDRPLATAISDRGWGAFRQMLADTAEQAGRHLAVTDRRYPSSKTRSACGHPLDKLSRSTRAWTCPACRTRHDRDTNAAKNILAAGLAATACRGDVRHPEPARTRPPVKQEPQSARVGIPRF